MQAPVADTPHDAKAKSRSLFTPEPAAADSEIDLLEYWRSISKRKWAILLFGVVVALLAGVVVFSLTPVYRATTTVLIESNKAKVVSIEDVYSGMSQNREYFQTQAEIIKSREVAMKTIKAMRLWDHPEFDPRTREVGAVQKLLRATGVVAEPEPIEWNDKNMAEAVYAQFSTHMSVELVRQSQLAKISFESASPEMASRVANTLANTYISNDFDARYEMTRKAGEWLESQMVGLKTAVEDSERKLQNYRERAGIIETKDLAQSGAGRQIDELSQRLSQLRLRRAEAESIYDQIRSAKKGEDMGSLPAVLRDGQVSSAKMQESIAERKLSEIAQRYGPEHARYVAAEADLKTAREASKRAVDLVVASVTREYETSLSIERTLENNLNRARGAVQNLNRKEFELGVLEREVASNRQMYELFMKRAKETSVAGDLQSAIARVVDAATVPTKPIKPQKMQIIAIALVLGLFIGVLAALLIDRLDNTLKSSHDVEAKLKAPLLAVVPKLAKSETRRTSTARVVLDKPNSIFSEAIRSARTGVTLSAIDQSHRILVVTSSMPGEGKTTMAINLAMAHSQTQRTLLIDADMRRPAVAKGLELPPGAKGLSNLVAGSATINECIQTIDGTQLSVISSGTLPPNPLELLLSARFKETLDLLALRYETIIIDSPPVELVSDALVIGTHATGVIYVVKAHETPYQLVRKGLTRIQRADGHLLGIALNYFDFASAEKYHGDYSGYGKYGYGQSDYHATYGTQPKAPAAKA